MGFDSVAAAGQVTPVKSCSVSFLNSDTVVLVDVPPQIIEFVRNLDWKVKSQWRDGTSYTITLDDSPLKSRTSSPQILKRLIGEFFRLGFRLRAEVRCPFTLAISDQLVFEHVAGEEAQVPPTWGMRIHGCDIRLFDIPPEIYDQFINALGPKFTIKKEKAEGTTRIIDLKWHKEKIGIIFNFTSAVPAEEMQITMKLIEIVGEMGWRLVASVGSGYTRNADLMLFAPSAIPLTRVRASILPPHETMRGMVALTTDWTKTDEKSDTVIYYLRLVNATPVVEGSMAAFLADSWDIKMQKRGEDDACVTFLASRVQRREVFSGKQKGNGVGHLVLDIVNLLRSHGYEYLNRVQQQGSDDGNALFFYSSPTLMAQIQSGAQEKLFGVFRDRDDTITVLRQPQGPDIDRAILKAIETAWPAGLQETKIHSTGERHSFKCVGHPWYGRGKGIIGDKMSWNSARLINKLLENLNDAGVELVGDFGNLRNGELWIYRVRQQ